MHYSYTKKIGVLKGWIFQGEIWPGYVLIKFCVINPDSLKLRWN